MMAMSVPKTISVRSTFERMELPLSSCLVMGLQSASDCRDAPQDLQELDACSSGAVQAEQKVSVDINRNPHLWQSVAPGVASAPHLLHVCKALSKIRALDRTSASAHVRPNVRAKLPAEAGFVSPVCDDAPCATDRAYKACRSGSA